MVGNDRILGVIGLKMSRAEFHEFCLLLCLVNIGTTLANLHWLRAAERITFKLAILTFRCFQGPAPRYGFADFIPVTDMQSRRRRRSSSSDGLIVRPSRLLAAVMHFRSLTPTVEQSSRRTHSI